MSVNVDRLRIVHYPDPVLRQRAEAVDASEETVRRVAVRMLALMKEAEGVGLAAPQVGLSWRLFVANPSGQAGDDRVFINPELSEPTRETEPYEEGCLSLPFIRGEVTRPRGIVVTATGLEGERFTLRGEGLPARVWQHEQIGRAHV